MSYYLHGQGIMVRMVTGDNLDTAIAIAKECGILTDGGLAIEGPEFRAKTPVQTIRCYHYVFMLFSSSYHDVFILLSWCYYAILVLTHTFFILIIAGGA